MHVATTPHFVRMFRKLPKTLQEEALEKIALFQRNPKHPQLKTHKLHGKLKGRYSFSVNYQIRIVFTYLSDDEVVLLAIGSHDVYRQ